jgi:mannose-6-phosphate isomerase-like protein (cupin superfamily)
LPAPGALGEGRKPPTMDSKQDYPWNNQTLCRVNGSVVRLGAIQGGYHRHSREKDGEFFLVVEGRPLIDAEGRAVELLPRQGSVVPRGAVHRTRAPGRTVILMAEPAGIIPTGGRAIGPGRPAAFPD